jgi:hypothetical protein
MDKPFESAEGARTFRSISPPGRIRYSRRFTGCRWTTVWGRNVVRRALYPQRLLENRFVILLDGTKDKKGRRLAEELAR